MLSLSLSPSLFSVLLTSLHAALTLYLQTWSRLVGNYGSCGITLETTQENQFQLP